MDRTVNKWHNMTARQGVGRTLAGPNQPSKWSAEMAKVTDAAAAGVFQCKSCERQKSVNDFYASNLSRCKECVKSGVRENRAANVDYYRAYDRKRYRDNPHRQEAARRSAQSEAGQEGKARYMARIKSQEPEKYRARIAVGNAIRDGKIARGTECYFCGGDKNLHAHHEDYGHPLDVVWLCASCHGKLHTIKGDFRRTSKGSGAHD